MLAVIRVLQVNVFCYILHTSQSGTAIFYSIYAVGAIIHLLIINTTFMRYALLALLSIVITISNGQALSTNPQTGLVWIYDSLEVSSSSLQEIKDHLTKWGQYTS